MDLRAAPAVRLLTRVFASVPVPLAFRLWDGTTARVGSRGVSPFTVVVTSRRMLRRLLRRPSPLCFGEAFIAGEIDIEGDLFAAMAVANHIEELRLGLGTRLAVLAWLLRI